MKKISRETIEEKYYGVIFNLVGDLVQDLDTYSWRVFTASETQHVVILVSEEKDLSKTKMRIESDIDFLNNYYQYKGLNGKPKKLKDIYA